VVDALSRRVHELHAIAISMYQTDVKRKFLEATNTDLQYKELIAKLQQGKTPQKMNIYKLGVDGILLHKNRIFVPNVQDLKHIILHEIHNAPYAGHPGYQKTVAVVKSQYFWPGMKRKLQNTSLGVWNARKLKQSIGTQHDCCNLFSFLNGSGKW
jgi:hypothetical protein